LLVGIYLVMNIACVGYFARRAHGFNLVSHLIVPVLGIAAFIPAWLAGAGLKAPGLSFIPRLSPPLSYMGPATAIWVGVGVIYVAYLYARHRQRITDVALIHLESEPGEAADSRVAT
jgi:hypothetical protein